MVTEQKRERLYKPYSQPNPPRSHVLAVLLRRIPAEVPRRAHFIGCQTV